MERLQQLLNFTDANGQVITVLNGRFTLGQVLMFAIALLAICLIWKFVKGVIKAVVIVAVVCVVLVYTGVTSPTQLKDIGSQIAEAGIDSYKAVANASEHVKIQGGKLTVLMDDDDTWYDVTEIDSIIKGEDDVMTVIINGKPHITSDTAVISLLDTFK